MCGSHYLDSTVHLLVSNKCRVNHKCKGSKIKAMGEPLTALKRTGVTQYCGMLVASALPKNWNTDTSLMRFVEENGASTTFYFTGGALEQFKLCEQWRIYKMTVPGKCVKTSDGTSKFGVHSVYDVVMKFPCADLSLSDSSWHFQFPYKFKDWEGLNQVPSEGYIDLIGCVLQDPLRDANSGIPKLVVQLGNENYIQEVHFLGEHANLTFRKKDVIALAGMKIHAWREQRTVQSAYLSVIESNPVSRANVKHPSVADDEEPKRKALRLAKSTIVSVAEAKALQQKAKLNYDPNGSQAPQQFTIVGQISAFDADFFKNDPPMLDVKDKEVMCFAVALEDETGTMEVKVWDRACYDILGVTASKLRELWEEGATDASKQSRILETLNAGFEHTCQCACSLRIWKKGFKEFQIETNINVNAIEVNEDAK